jgi:hypothetical protein
LNIHRLETPSAERSELHAIDDAAACKLVDETLGAADEWRSLIIRYRFSSDFQAHWKAEVGHWIHTARRHGFQDPLVQRVRARANNEKPRTPDKVTLEDRLYTVLLQELGPAMVAHYLLSTGWSFRTWDMPDGAGGDVDLGVRAPDGVAVDIQIKVPGTENPLASVEKAARQLRSSPNRAVIVVCSRDPQFPSCEPDEFFNLIGNTTNYDGVVCLNDRGRFESEDFRHVGGLVLLDYIPGAIEQTYCCTVLTNPWAASRSRTERAWFPRARVLLLDGERFRWEPEPPDLGFEFPNGTFVSDPFR